MIRRTLRSLWSEPRVAQPPGPMWRDWALVAVIAVSAVLEGLLRDDVVWRSLSVAIAIGLSFVLPWRRTHPFVAVVIAFGTVTTVDMVALARDVAWEGLGTMVYFLILPYSLFRWGSGRHATVGLALMFVVAGLASFDSTNTTGDVLGGFAILALAAAIGALVRYEDNSRARALDQVKAREREELARELHDTVAHHVSAIAVQAQAGRTLAARRPDAATEALAVIEEAASRTLTEMRTMVSVLREGGEPELAPQPGVADIARLAKNGANGLQIDVDVTGDLDDLRPSVDAALYRLAQESITNATRHARRASRVDVRIVGDVEQVRLTVSDDGSVSTVDPQSAAGFGLVGMAERAKLLGGTFEAGPRPDRGWMVSAALPKDGDS